MKNLGIGVRLGTGFGVVLLLSALMTVFGMMRLQQVAGHTQAMMQHRAVAVASTVASGDLTSRIDILEEAAAAAGSLEEQAQRLKQAVSTFRLAA